MASEVPQEGVPQRLIQSLMADKVYGEKEQKAHYEVDLWSELGPESDHTLS
jgi:hypothetical protein